MASHNWRFGASGGGHVRVLVVIGIVIIADNFLKRLKELECQKNSVMLDFDC